MGLGRVKVDRLDPVRPCEELALDVEEHRLRVSRMCHRDTYHLELFSRRSLAGKGSGAPSLILSGAGRRRRGGGDAEGEEEVWRWRC
jgi:hypothetical protein